MTTAKNFTGFLIAAVAIALGLAAAWVWIERHEPDSNATRADSPVNVIAPQLPAPAADPQVALLGSESSTSRETQRLILVATTPGRNSREGRAALGTDPRNPQIYSAGALLANGAYLEEIFADYVVLSLGEKRSILALPGVTPHLSAAHRDLADDGAASHIGGAETVDRPLDRVATSRVDLSDVIRAQPVFDHDEFSGLQILPGTDGGRLAVLELKSGDIVRTINGKRLKSADEAWQALDDAISTSTPLVISIERDGSLMSMSLDGSRLVADSSATGS